MTAVEDDALHAENSGSGNGVYGSSSANGGDGVHGYTLNQTGSGVAGINGAADGYGVYGSGQYGVYGTGTSYGVYGTSGGAYGVWGATSSGYGVYGNASSSGYGVYGNSSSNFGVYGISSTATAIYGDASLQTTGSKAGVKGISGSAGGYGVVGANSNTGIGVYGTEVTAGAGVAVWGENNSSATGAWAGYFHGNFYYTGSFTSTSDIRLKKNVKPMDGALNQLLQLQGVTFEWKDPEGRGKGTQRGFIAQDVEKLFPNWVSEDREGFKAVSTKGIEAMLVESVRELNSKNGALQAMNDKQQAQIDKLTDAVEKLKNGKDPISRGPGFGTGMLALFMASVAGATGLMMKRLGLSLATVVGLLIAGRKRDKEKRS